MYEQADALKDQIDELTVELQKMRMILGDIVEVFNEVHQMYPSTAVCWGGIGGAMMTNHCSWECDNHQAHREANSSLRILLGEARRLAQGGAL